MTSVPRTAPTDSLGRRLAYLRLSVTPACTFRCVYCLPDGSGSRSSGRPLTVREIGRLLAGFAGIGLGKVRLSGGEATTRSDFAEIIRTAAHTPGIRTVALTTNGYRLERNARIWRQAGLATLNVSVDSLNRETFARIAGVDHLHQVLGGLEAALEAGFERVKINTVLLKTVNDREVGAFLNLARDRPLDVRFIELMRTHDNAAFFERHHLRADTLVRQLEELGWVRQGRAFDDGPARVYTHPDSRGRVGIIAPYSRDFCTACNRVRVTATGELRLCLFGTEGVSLRPYLQEDRQRPLLQHTVLRSLALKPAGHRLASGDSGVTDHLASIGG
ncbi:GTP 3',8-cyclase MoaA [Phaeovibrio sulfidiphilus]|uniref:GTP 3',8-cyclase MoaA n=1 Tax=Phaeovibrio sulfidiphilus TaxID=1220600 RepID=A0A8J6YMV4_9PROT|nr:GTP 3',8-cyclase MoaA [Phaeovibrio sulfidiphilus]MBE1237385.1 GTP 3',8-cyclase MoaA [Phaeovibrio sulfidiphilus]